MSEETMPSLPKAPGALSCKWNGQGKQRASNGALGATVQTRQHDKANKHTGGGRTEGNTVYAK